VNPIKQLATRLETLMSDPRCLRVLLAAVTLAVFSQAAFFDFVAFDDDDYFRENPHVLSGLSLGGIAWAFQTGFASNWHPLTWISLMLDVDLFGGGPMAPHITNILLHTANVVLLFALLRRLTGSHWKSAMVAALFAWHPLHVESVAWISERKDVLSGFFALLTLFAYARYVAQAENSTSKSSVTRQYLVVLGMFALALMSKPMMVTLPFLLLLLDYWPLRRFDFVCANAGLIRRLILEKAPLFLLSILSCAVTYLVQKNAGSVRPLEEISMNPRIQNAFVSYVRYLFKMVWPVHLAIPYPHPGFWTPARMIISVVLLVGVSLAALRLVRRIPYFAVGWFWYLGMLVPVIGIVQVGVQSMADRYTYFPLIGIFIVGVWGVSELRERQVFGQIPAATLSGVAVLIIAICAIMSFLQVRYWRNTETLFSHAIRSTRNNDRAYYNLGVYYLGHDRTDEAVDCYRKALQIRPTYADALNNLGVALAKKGQWDEAVQVLRRAVLCPPVAADTYYNLGNLLAMQKKLDQATRCYVDALRLKPDYFEAHNNLANILMMQGHTNEAVRHYQEVLRLNPNHEGAQRQLRLLDLPVR
jgi:tetratricopeptide (TPR) repeat protein